MIMNTKDTEKSLIIDLMDQTSLQKTDNLEKVDINPIQIRNERIAQDRQFK